MSSHAPVRRGLRKKYFLKESQDSGEIIYNKNGWTITRYSPDRYRIEREAVTVTTGEDDYTCPIELDFAHDDFYEPSNNHSINIFGFVYHNPELLVPLADPIARYCDFERDGSEYIIRCNLEDLLSHIGGQYITELMNLIEDGADVYDCPNSLTGIGVSRDEDGIIMNAVAKYIESMKRVPYDLGGLRILKTENIVTNTIKDEITLNLFKYVIGMLKKWMESIKDEVNAENMGYTFDIYFNAVFSMDATTLPNFLLVMLDQENEVYGGSWSVIKTEGSNTIQDALQHSFNDYFTYEESSELENPLPKYIRDKVEDAMEDLDWEYIARRIRFS